MSGVPEPRNPAAFDTVIGIVGSPAFPEIAWSDEQLASLKELGCTTLQLSIAWANKPADEVLNLEDLDERQRGLWRHRITQARKFGLGTIAHFGIPGGSIRRRSSPPVFWILRSATSTPAC